MNMTIPAAMAILRNQGFVTVNVAFSGGNDEGGADSIVGVKADGTEVDLPESNAYEDSEWDATTRTRRSIGWVVHTWEGREHKTRPATTEEIQNAGLRELLEGPIYAEYGGFGFEGYVTGTLTWDVATGRSEMHGKREVTSWEDF